MQKSGGVAILMQNHIINFHELKIRYEVGNSECIVKMQKDICNTPFSDRVISFLNELSKILLANRKAKQYPDVITFGFWIRRASVEQLKMHYFHEIEKTCRLGRGIAFHIAPSNVPVNYAYSLATGLLCGNANIVRVSSKAFPQIDIINDALREALERFSDLKKYLVLVRYEHDKQINQILSELADIRVIWGGDATIREFRTCVLKPRATEITFADRYSIAVIDSEEYMNLDEKNNIIQGFYNDTYLTDQNACTSPRIVVWTGKQKEEAKRDFWERLHGIVKGKYNLQAEQIVNKLTNAYLFAAQTEKDDIVSSEDNLIVRIHVAELSEKIMDYKGNSGYFFEYDCDDILEMKVLCDHERCQTISYLGDVNVFQPLLKNIRGVDRIVPIGRTMDFDLLWDGYDLFERMTRIISIKG